MKALLYHPSGRADLAEVPVPPIGPSEALIAVDACGLCGTDLMKLAAKKPQAVLGHEVAGRIAKVGRNVKGFSEGDRVVAAHHVPCLDCHYCRKGHVSMCRQFKATNIEPGGFADYVRLSELHVRHALFKIKDGLDALAASQTEPLACCLRNVKRLNVGPGDCVGIVGLGAIGLMTAQLLRHFGVKVLGLDLDKERAQALSSWGRGFTEAARFEKEIEVATEGRGLDALVYTAGTAAMVRERMGWIRDGGTLNVFASFHPPELQLDLNEVYHRELTVMSSYSPAIEDLEQSLELIASGKITLAAIKIKTFGLDEFAEAERQVRARQIMKAILLPNGKKAR